MCALGVGAYKVSDYVNTYLPTPDQRHGAASLLSCAIKAHGTFFPYGMPAAFRGQWTTTSCLLTCHNDEGRLVGRQGR